MSDSFFVEIVSEESHEVVQSLGPMPRDRAERVRNRLRRLAAGPASDATRDWAKHHARIVEATGER